MRKAWRHRGPSRLCPTEGYWWTWQVRQAYVRLLLVFYLPCAAFLMVFTHLFLVLRSLPSSCWLVSSRHCWLMRPTSEHWRISQTKIRMGSSVRHQRFNNPAHRVLGPKFFCVYPPPFFLQYYDHPIVTMPPPPPPLLPLSPSFIPTFRYHPHPPISHTHNHTIYINRYLPYFIVASWPRSRLFSYISFFELEL